jgi:hypothetical protein
MRTSTAITALFAACVAAAPTIAPAEEVVVSNFLVRKTSGVDGTAVQVVAFDIPSFHCEAQNPTLPSAATQCQDGSTYFFSLVPGAGDAEFGLEITRYFRDGSKLFGSADVPTVCRAGGNGPTDYVCTKATPVTITISAQ